MNNQISIDELTLRAAINNFTLLLRNPDNKAAQTLARCSVNTLTGYLPETLERELAESSKSE